MSDIKKYILPDLDCGCDKCSSKNSQAEAGVLTIEMIEEAALKAANQQGAYKLLIPPDYYSGVGSLTHTYSKDEE